MPLKPLQRLALRPAVVTRASPAQPWHNITITIRGRSLHATTRGCLQESPGFQQRQQRLFEELFPRQQAKPPSSSLGTSRPDSTSNDKSTQPKWASQISDELPPLAPSEELRRLSEMPEDYDEGDHANFLGSAQQSHFSPGGTTTDSNPALRATTMLVLNATSKQLVESDFLRIGTKGQHVPGWVNGIVRVIQGRDQATLEPLGHYFILFDRHEAAVAYAEEVHRLRDLAKRYTPGASHAGRHEQRRHGLPQGLPTDTGEDVATLIKSFTLVPPTMPPRLRIAERLADDRVSNLDRDGALVDDVVRALGGHRHLVMVHIADGGSMPVEMLRQAIRVDGIQRNLRWRVVNLDKGIWPFGSSVLKPLDEQSGRYGTKGTTTKSAAGEAAKTYDDEGAGMTDNVDDDGNDKSSLSSGAAGPASSSTNDGGDKGSKRRFYPRFLVAFSDEPEARRFIRHWHRRELSRSLTLSPGTGPGLSPSVKRRRTKAAPWEDAWILNVSWLW